MKKFFVIIIFMFSFFYTKIHLANEIIIYADSINYDSEKNIIAKGNAKIIKKVGLNEQILTSDLIIINDVTNELTLPIDFQYRDEGKNYYYGSSGKFSSNLDTATINDVKMLLNDGSRIVGKKGFKTGKIDLINKGVYSPCNSKIKIFNYVCPIWQIEGEKILHDRDKLFLYHKHSKMSVLNTPVYYLPYMVTPSPLRKKRKSGFLNPSLSFSFLDIENSQSLALPYYFAISEDSELYFTPRFNYGGGVDSSQTFLSDYKRIISGGNLDINVSVASTIENENNENWLQDASIITTYSQNLNEKFHLSVSSAFQSSPTYLRRSDKNNILNRDNALTSTLNLSGYNLRKIDDRLSLNITGYQVVKKDDNNKTTPTTLPFIKYSTGFYRYNKTKYIQEFSGYNIFRELGTVDHAQKQQKIQHQISTDTEKYNFNSKFNIKTILNTQGYNIENKKVSNTEFTGTYSRAFPMTGLYIESPLRSDKNNLYILPKISFILNSSQPNSNKISNEESTNNIFSLLNIDSLNRFTGTDKLDNSKRANYGIEISKSLKKEGTIRGALSQSYEFDKDSHYNKEVGLKDYMSDLLGSSSITTENNSVSHDFRFNVDQGVIKSQSLNYTNISKIGSLGAVYYEDKIENNAILETNQKKIDLNFTSSKIRKYSKITMSTSYNFITDDPVSHAIGYQYTDECFGVDLNFNRSFFTDRDLKPEDSVILMFSFKHLGSYASTNLAVSEQDKQDINWDTGSVDNARFN